MLYSSQQQSRTGGDPGAEYVTDWRVVAAFSALAALLAAGLAGWFLLASWMAPPELQLAAQQPQQTSAKALRLPVSTGGIPEARASVEKDATDAHSATTSDAGEADAQSDVPTDRETSPELSVEGEATEAPSLPQSVDSPFELKETIVAAESAPQSALQTDDEAEAFNEKLDAVAVVAETECNEPETDEPLAPASEYDFFVDLNHFAQELDFESVKGSTAKVMAATSVSPKKDAKTGDEIRRELLASRPDLAGLPLLDGGDCRTSPETARAMAAISSQLGRALNTISFRGRRASGSFSFSDEMEWEQQREQQIVEQIRRTAPWRTKEAISTLVQMLQVESAPIRLELVSVLSEIDDRGAGRALAERALFDASPEVRKAAIKALDARPVYHYRERLLEGFRYPWAPVAYYAAEALLTVEDRASVVMLVELLDEPNPNSPFMNDEGVWVKRELVRVNHFRNCVLCHAPSQAGENSLVTGPVPTPGSPIPVLYYQSRSRRTVRADVTYLRQDFSAMHDVPDADPWPAKQRYDYFVRVRALDELEADAAELKHRYSTRPVSHEVKSYPQREAVLLALRELTGNDAGNRSEGWRELVERRYANPFVTPPPAPLDLRDLPGG